MQTAQATANIGGQYSKISVGFPMWRFVKPTRINAQRDAGSSDGRPVVVTAVEICGRSLQGPKYQIRRTFKGVQRVLDVKIRKRLSGRDFVEDP